MMAMIYLAEVSDVMSLREILPWVTMFVVAVIGAVLTPILKTRWKEEAKREVKLGPQPFEIRMKEEFVTRREFERLETAFGVSALKMEASFEKFVEASAKQNDNTAKRLVSQSDRLSKKIEEVAGGAYQGRQRIHITQNEHTAQIAALQANINVADQIGRLADALLSVPTKVQPTHQNS